MSEPERGDRDRAADLEQQYVAEHAETEQLLTGLDPEGTDQGATDQVEGVAKDASSAGHVERMAGDS